MKFKDWLMKEIRFKGFERLFRASNPNLPKYVANQIYQNRLGPNLGNSIEKGFSPISQTIYVNPAHSYGPLASTIEYNPQSNFSSPRPSPSDMISNAKYLEGISWTKRPIVIKITPLSFDDQTLHLFKNWRFGFAPKDFVVKNDSARFDIQRKKLTQQLEGENEPLILVKVDGKYKLLEGYHRAMLNLLCPHDDTRGAPPDQIELLKNNNLRSLDFTKWLPVSVKAYIGTKN